MRSFIKHFSKYSIVGIGSTITDIAVFTCLTKLLQMEPLLANLISRPAGGFFCFFFNKMWTFKAYGQGETGQQMVRFWIQWACGLIASEALIWLIHGLGSIEPVATKMIAETLIAVVNFLTMRLWTFKR